MDISPEAIESLGTLGVIVLGSGAAIRWLLAERKDLLARLATQSDRERELREKRTQELLEMSKLLSETRTVVAEKLTENTRVLEGLKEALEKWRA